MARLDASTDVGYWDGRADELNRRYDNPSVITRLLRRDLLEGHQLAVAVCREVQTSTFLDIGCGPGTVIEAVLAAGVAERADGVDLSQEMILSAARRLGAWVEDDRCDLRPGDFLSMDVPERSADVVVSFGVIDYLADPVPFLRKASRVARHRLIVNVPDRGLITGLRKLRHRGVGIHAYTSQGVDDLAERTSIGHPRKRHSTGCWFLVFDNLESG